MALIKFTTNIINTGLERPRTVHVNVLGNFPIGYTKTVQICNNAYDSSPYWETITNYELDDMNYKFKNQSKTATNYGIQVKVELDKSITTPKDTDLYVTKVKVHWR